LARFVCRQSPTHAFFVPAIPALLFLWFLVTSQPCNRADVSADVRKLRRSDFGLHGRAFIKPLLFHVRKLEVKSVANPAPSTVVTRDGWQKVYNRGIKGVQSIPMASPFFLAA
jgi:hypothetical protein